MTNPENILRDYTKGRQSTTRKSACGVDTNANLNHTGPLHFTVPNDYAGLRVDQALVKFLPEYSRSRMQEWIMARHVKVDGAFVTAKQKVWGGEKLEVLPQTHPAEQPYQAEDIALDILYEDDAIMVINKPAGLVVHPGSGNWEGTLLNALLHHAPQLADVPRAGIVHRLDKDTSGLLVVAKTIAAQTALVRQLEARSVKREYLALVHGEVSRAGKVDAPVGRHPTQRIKMAVTGSGKHAVTHYEIEKFFPAASTGSGQGCTLLRCRLETGRTHQIRVHMAHLKHPLVGDSTYLKGAQKCPPPPRHGGAKRSGAGGAAGRLLPLREGGGYAAGHPPAYSLRVQSAGSASNVSQPHLRELLNHFPRQALHAARLALEHPVSGEMMEWCAPLPQDMVHLLQQIEAIVNGPA